MVEGLRRAHHLHARLRTRPDGRGAAACVAEIPIDLGAKRQRLCNPVWYGSPGLCRKRDNSWWIS